MSWRGDAATVEQKRQLKSLYKGLGWDCSGIDKMKKGPASDAIEEAEDELRKGGRKWLEG